MWFRRRRERHLHKKVCNGRSLDSLFRIGFPFVWHGIPSASPSAWAFRACRELGRVLPQPQSGPERKEVVQSVAEIGFFRFA